jgi:hypothetical protein
MMKHPNQVPSKQDAGKNSRNRALQLEQLEARLMNAIDTIEMGLEAFSSSRLQAGPQSDVPGQYGQPTLGNSGRSGQAPTIVRPISFLTGTVVNGNSTRASVLASDNGGEHALVYRWSVTSAPRGATVAFTTNNSNDAKNTTIRFDRTGEYEFMVTLVDRSGLTASSTARLSVKPNLTTLQVVSSDGQVVNPATELDTSLVSPIFQVRGIDQFGQIMPQTPQPKWSLRSGPQSGTVIQNLQGDFTRFQFSDDAQYQLQASVGDKSVQLSVRNVRSSARLDLVDSTGRTVSEGGTVNVVGDRHTISMRVFNAQGNSVPTPSNVSWVTRSSPSGGWAIIRTQGAQTTLIFNRAGDYEFTAQANGFSRVIRFRVQTVLTTLAITTTNSSVQAGQTLQFTAVGRDQFGNAMASQPQISWSTTRGSISSTGLYSAGSSLGTRSVTATSGALRATVQITVVAPSPVATSLQLRDTSGNLLSDTIPVAITGRQLRVEVRLVDQLGRAMTSSSSITMTANSAPSGGTASLALSGSMATIDFTRAGNYEVTFTQGGLSRKLRITANSTLTTLQLNPNVVSLQTGQTRQFSAAGFDQFGQAIASIPTVAWSATGGSVSSNGLFTAGSVAGSSFSVRAQVGSISATAAVTVSVPVAGVFQNAGISQLVQTYYVDQLLDRTEVMAILRSVGGDSVVDAVELRDLRTLVDSTQFVMPAHVRGLARNTVLDNPANLRFQGQAAGNLAAGSSSALLNNLVDKWFLGVDVPAVAGSGTVYTQSVGTLFNVGPTLQDTKQGMLGDCYFLAAVGSIALRNQQAIRDMFDDNADGTYTVRFFGRNSSGVATADYVTVNRRLPTVSGSILAYAGYGLSATNPTTVIWAALAEKAYAQWNETGRAGRNGTNTFGGIEGGWMSNVNFQVLGYNSANYSFATAAQQTLINAINAGHAVTAGTKTSVPSNLVASHAYAITAYNSSTGQFTVYNPWGYMHPAPMTWSQLQAGFSMFTTTDPRGSGGDVASGGFRSELFFSGAPALDSTALIQRFEVGRSMQNAEVLSSSAGLAILQVAADPFENGLFENSIVFAVSTNEESLELAEDLDQQSEFASQRALMDLALKDLYIRSSLR